MGFGSRQMQTLANPSDNSYYVGMEKITIRLGSLEKPLLSYADRHGLTPSEVVRAALALRLGVAAPELSAGNPNLTPATARKMQKKAVKSRQKNKSENNP